MLTQLVANGLVAAALISLVGMGFAVIHGAGKFFHFAHALTFAAGGYTCFVGVHLLGFAPSVAVLGAVMVAALLGMIMEAGVYRPLKRRGADALVMLLASIGLMIVGQSTIALVFGSEVIAVRANATAASVGVFGAVSTPVQLAIIAAAAASVGGVSLACWSGTVGLRYRTVASDRQLAGIVGVRTERVVLWAFAFGSALAGLAGGLHALDVFIRPTMGFRPLLLGVIAMIIGGSWRATSVALGAIMVSTSQQIGAWWLGAEWMDAIALALLLGVLVVRPQGLVREPFRRAVA